MKTIVVYPGNSLADALEGAERGDEIHLMPDRRRWNIPHRRPRVTDMRSGERTYIERRGGCEKAS